MDFYSSTKSFLDQLSKIEKFMSASLLLFDDIFNPNHWINEHVGEELAIKEFNNKNLNLKLGLSLDNINDFKFPLGKGHLYMLNNFNHVDYKKYIGFETADTLGINKTKIKTKIF